jgi:hypothetical protein
MRHFSSHQLAIETALEEPVRMGTRPPVTLSGDGVLYYVYGVPTIGFQSCQMKEWTRDLYHVYSEDCWATSGAEAYAIHRRSARGVQTLSISTASPRGKWSASGLLFSDRSAYVLWTQSSRIEVDGEPPLVLSWTKFMIRYHALEWDGKEGPRIASESEFGRDVLRQEGSIQFEGMTALGPILSHTWDNRQEWHTFWIQTPFGRHALPEVKWGSILTCSPQGETFLHRPEGDTDLWCRFRLSIRLSVRGKAEDQRMESGTLVNLTNRIVSWPISTCQLALTSPVYHARFAEGKSDSEEIDLSGMSMPALGLLYQFYMCRRVDGAGSGHRCLVELLRHADHTRDWALALAVTREALRCHPHQFLSFLWQSA